MLQEEGYPRTGQSSTWLVLKKPHLTQSEQSFTLLNWTMQKSRTAVVIFEVACTKGSCHPWK